MTRVLDCPCGQRLLGHDADDIVEVALAHLREAHPHLTYTREDILMLAR